jgi:hypothetical protein
MFEMPTPPAGNEDNVLSIYKTVQPWGFWSIPTSQHKKIVSREIALMKIMEAKMKMMSDARPNQLISFLT